MKLNTKNMSIMQRVFKAFIIFGGLFLLGLVIWTQKNFGKVTIDQTFSTLDLGIKGAFSSDSVYIKRLVIWSIINPLIITILYLALTYISFKSYISKMISALPIAIFLIGIFTICNQYSIFNYVVKYIHQPKIDYYQTHFVDAKDINIQTQHPKSLVLIYVESLEATYSENNLFDHDLLHDLHQLDVNKISFKSYKQMPGTGWTIAGMISTQCGIPLKLMTVFKSNQIGKHVSQFLPGATCLSDILAEHGYKNVFMNGTSLKFAGVGNFLESHHYHEMYGKVEWLAKGYKKSDMNRWGLPDDELFKNAKLKLAELIKGKQPFNLTILTIDTHGPAGLLSNTCKQRGVHDFEGIVECTADQVAGFVNYVKSNGWLDKVNIVIVGDHLAMTNPVSGKLISSPTRSIFNMIISNHKLQKNTDEIVGFDMLPTILQLQGFKFNGDRVGLGYSAISKNTGAREVDRVIDMQNQLEYNSKIYNKFWLTSTKN